jgi:hypothetical protein
VPEVTTLAQLNDRLVAADLADRNRKIRLRARSIGEDFAAEAPLLGPLPTEPFAAGLTLRPRVDREATLTVRMNDYSVPARFIGRRLRVVLRAADLSIYDGRVEVAAHPRLAGRGGQRLVLDHYLEILLRKPGALAGSEALDQARREGTFTADHEAFWAAAQAATTEPAGTRALIGVLLLHRHLHADDVTAGIRAALAVGAPTVDIVAVEARKAAQDSGRSPTITTAPPSRPAPPVLTTPTVSDRALARVADLPGDRRPPPDLSHWDQLLHHPRKEPS